MKGGSFMNQGSSKPVRRGFGDSMLLVFGAGISWIYGMAFGPLGELAFRERRKKFIAEIEQEFSGLFSRRVGWVVPKEGLELPRAFDYVGVTVEFAEVRFRIIRGREELRVQTATLINPEDWQDISLLWHQKAMRECGSPPSCNEQLGEVAERLEQNWDQLLATLLTSQ